MDPVGIAFAGFGLYICLLYSYEVWFAPQKFQKRIDRNRMRFRSGFGFAFWSNSKVNIAYIKPMLILGIIISLLGLIGSIGSIGR